MSGDAGKKKVEWYTEGLRQGKERSLEKEEGEEEREERRRRVN